MGIHLWRRGSGVGFVKLKVKILLQRLWEQKIDWDDPVPTPIYNDWLQWRSKLHLLSSKHIPRCYFDGKSQITSVQLHGFCDVSENAYAAVVYLRLTDAFGKVQISLVTSKTKAPIKKLTIPRLELCGAHLLAQLLHHVQLILDIPHNFLYAWTDSTIVLNWLVGNPRRFKTYVGNRVSYIMELVTPERWNHVEGLMNPADCASRGMFPSELLEHTLWWNGPIWLHQDPSQWPKQLNLPPPETEDEERELSLHAVLSPPLFMLNINDYSTFTRLKCVIFRFISNCRSSKLGTEPSHHTYFTTQELCLAEKYCYSIVQQVHFKEEITAAKSTSGLNKASPLLSLRPMIDPSGLLRVCGRQQYS